MGFLGNVVPVSDFTFVPWFSPEHLLEEPEVRKELDTSVDVVGSHLPQGTETSVVGRTMYEEFLPVCHFLPLLSLTVTCSPQSQFMSRGLDDLSPLFFPHLGSTLIDWSYGWTSEEVEH